MLTYIYMYIHVCYEVPMGVYWDTTSLKSKYMYTGLLYMYNNIIEIVNISVLPAERNIVVAGFSISASYRIIVFKTSTV